MQAAFWHDRWERNEIGFHRADINVHLQQFWQRLKVCPGTQVLVPLCGKSRDLAWLAGQGYPVLGVELSPLAVRAFFTEHGLRPQIRQQKAYQRWQAGLITLLCGDFFGLGPADLGEIAGIYDRAALIALPPPLRRIYAKQLQALAPGAPLLLVSLEYPQEAMQGPPFAVSATEIAALYGAYRIETLFEADVLAGSPRFQARGLPWLRERVYHLSPVAPT